MKYEQSEKERIIEKLFPGTHANVYPCGCIHLFAPNPRKNALPEKVKFIHNPECPEHRKIAELLEGVSQRKKGDSLKKQENFYV